MLLFLLLIVLCSCSGRRNQTLPSNQELEKLLLQNKDSLALLLETETDPNQLTDKDKAEYGYWIVLTHLHQERSLINDSLIHFTTHYYERHDSSRLARAYTFAGAQINWSGKKNNQQDSLLNKALQVASIQKDTALIKEIYSQKSNFYTRTKKHLEAIEVNRKLMKITQGKDRLGLIFSHVLNFSILDEKDKMPGVQDSIFKYIRMGMDTDDNSYGTKFYLSRINIETLNAAGRSKEALQEINKLGREPHNSSALAINYITTWLNLHQPDSAKVYLDHLATVKEKMDESVEQETIAYVLKAFQLLYEQQKGIPVTLIDFGNYADESRAKNEERIRIDRERQFAQNKLAQDNLKLKVERGKLYQSLLWTLVGLLVAIAVLIYFYQRKLLDKERSVQQFRKQLQASLLQLNENQAVIDNNEQLIHALNTQLSESKEQKESLQEQIDDIERLSADNDRLRQKNDTLRREISSFSNMLQEKDQEIESYERLVEQNRKLQERERFLALQLIDRIDILRQLRLKPRYIEENQWPEIIQLVNLLYDNFLHRLHHDFPTLTEEDLRNCCLIKLQFTTSVIAILTAISPSSVTKRKQRIKEKIKQVTGDLDKEQPLEIFLWTY